MRQLAPDLFDRRFENLMEMGRARLPSLAPEWTDHNAHDPGITLMELLAWVAEAQLYSLSHVRRDERVAYAALLGLRPGGTRAAQGLIWLDPLDSRAPVRTYARSVVISDEAVVNVVDTEAPTFRPTRKLLWVPGRITKLESRLADGRVLDHTTRNERGGPAFYPFGEGAGRRDILAISFECHSETGLFPPHRPEATGAYWTIGVRADGSTAAGASEPAKRARGRAQLAATLVVGTERVPVAVEDMTEGLMRTGVLFLDVSNVPNSATTFTLELRAPGGSERAPRLLRIEPSVVPIVQVRKIVREQHVSTGLPDWSFQLEAPGLRFEPGEEPVLIEVAEPTGLYRWEQRQPLAQPGPDDRVYELDAASGRVTFGNGVNGRKLEQGYTVYATYTISDGDAGSVARNRKWKVAGFDGAFGVNPDAVAGGAAPLGWIDQRREARRRSHEDRALVSAADIESAARTLPLLEVERAWVVPPSDHMPRTGVVTLVVMRARPSGMEPDAVPETRRWLEAVRRRLTPRIPLGARLVVTAPRYVEFSIRASVEIEPGRDPVLVRKEIDAALARRLALVSASADVVPRVPGVPVARRDVTAWIRAVDGVRRIVELVLLGANGRDGGPVITVPPGALPRFGAVRSTFDINRTGLGGRR